MTENELTLGKWKAWSINSWSKTWTLCVPNGSSKMHHKWCKGFQKNWSLEWRSNFYISIFKNLINNMRLVECENREFLVTVDDGGFVRMLYLEDLFKDPIKFHNFYP